jgi:hypothetical protein
VPRQKNTFQTLQGASPDPHALSRFEKGVRATRKFPLDQNSNRTDLLVGDGRPDTLGSDQSDHTVSPKHTLPIFVARHQLDEQITAE